MELLEKLKFHILSLFVIELSLSIKGEKRNASNIDIIGGPAVAWGVSTYYDLPVDRNLVLRRQDKSGKWTRERYLSGVYDLNQGYFKVNLDFEKREREIQTRRKNFVVAKTFKALEMDRIAEKEDGRYLAYFPSRKKTPRCNHVQVQNSF
ncbi:hypothetical protein HI914_07026 [Erysiphe necator]|nr:hypothetical protein HI914_07026 [Erysiphe necator]